MPASLKEWVSRLENHIPPAMPLTVQRVRELMQHANTTHADYQSVVARDPGFALALYRYLANLPRPPREPITHLAHAISLAGLAPLQAASESVPLLESSADPVRWSGLQRGYSRAAHAACYAFDLGSRRGDANPDELMLAALLNQCGELALWSQAPERMLAIEQCIADGAERDPAAIAELGFTLQELSGALADAWSLPPLVGQAQPFAGAFQPRSLGIMLATELARSSETSWCSDETLGLVEVSAEYCGLQLEAMLVQVHRSAVDVAHRLHGLPLPVTASELLMLPCCLTAEVAPASDDAKPVGQPQESRLPDRTEAPSPSIPKEAGTVTVEPIPKRQPQRSRTPDKREAPSNSVREEAVAAASDQAPGPVSRTTDRPAALAPATTVNEKSGGDDAALQKKVTPRRQVEQPTVTTGVNPNSPVPADADQGAPPLPKQSDDALPPVKISPRQAPIDRAEQVLDDKKLQREMTQLFRQLRADAGVERVVFAMTTSDRKSLRARFVIGADKEAPLRRFQVDLGQRSLFSAMLSKAQSFWFNADNRDKYRPAIPQSLQQAIDMQGFFASSIHFDGRPIGLIYADSSAPLDQAQFDRFRRACQLLQKSLAGVDDVQAAAG
jgi:HD-like signal output (HDOD) protein